MSNPIILVKFSHILIKIDVKDFFFTVVCILTKYEILGLIAKLAMHSTDFIYFVSNEKRKKI